MGASLLTLTHCTCWGCQCAVKPVKHKESRPNNFWIPIANYSNGKFASPNSYDFHNLQWPYIKID